MAKPEQPSLNIAPANIIFGPGADAYVAENGGKAYVDIRDIKLGVNVVLLPGFEGHQSWVDVRELISSEGIDSTLA